MVLTPALKSSIADAIRTTLTPRHVPRHLIQVQDIPYTANGKKVENVVRDIVSGRLTTVSGTVVNPECLEEYKIWAKESMREQKRITSSADGNIVAKL